MTSTIFPIDHSYHQGRELDNIALEEREREREREGGGGGEGEGERGGEGEGGRGREREGGGRLLTWVIGKLSVTLEKNIALFGSPLSFGSCTS
jgi:hypothetical protein